MTSEHGGAPAMDDGTGHRREHVTALSRSADEWIEDLGLTPSAVGGWFATAMISDETIAGPALPLRFQVDHPVYSSNWYLLKAGEVLQLHTLKQDELWFFHEGVGIHLHVFDEGNYSVVKLGADPGAGQILHGFAPHSTWFGAELAGPGHGLVSCSLSPGYESSDSARPTAEIIQQLIDSFPSHRDVIGRLTQPSAPAVP
jgi:predicted cupin superfamily sugar epimerase